jgi:hypothetical protein
MKYTTLKATFKNGMVSPRLRGREKDGDITSAAEKIENFTVDRIGGLVKRGGIQMPQKQPFNNVSDDSFRYDSSPIADTVDTTYFAVNLRGREFIFRFNKTKAFNQIVNEINPSTQDHIQSDFLSVIDPATGDYQRCRPYAMYSVGSLGGINGQVDLTAFNRSQGPVTTELAYYLRQVYPSPTHMVKVTDSTVVFTCGSSRNNISNISFTVSLINLPTVGGGVPTTEEVFVILPYFVNVRAFVANLGMGTPDPNYLIPILPLNFPFNAVNTRNSFRVSVSLYGGQSGTDTADGFLAYTGDKLAWELTIPKAACLGLIDNVAYTDPDSVLGKFIIIPDTSNLRDVCFFITRFTASFGDDYKFSTIKITGGVPELTSPKWRLSTFGGQTHPRTAAYCFGRLMYGNAGIERAKWWASGVHPSNPTNFQGFLGRSLTQDATSDVSRMLNEGIATPGVTDLFRYGFSEQVPNLGAISFIESRRRIHFGTLEGECQAEISSNNFTRLTYSQYIIRSNSATLHPGTRGDGKIFYIANYGRDIRFLSTEDKDYESVDGLVTTALEGYDIIFNKILWVEKLGAIVARTTLNRFFLITLHEDTQIKAITEFISELDIVDFCISVDNLFFAYNYKGYRHVSKFLPTTSNPNSLLNDVYLGGDLSVCFPSVTGELRYGNIYAHFIGESVYLFYNGIEYTINVPLAYDGDPDSIALPVDISGATVTNPAFFYGKKITAKLRSMPITDGGGNDSAVGDVTRVDRVLVQVDGSGPFRIGNENGTIYDAEGVQLLPLSTKYVKFDMPQSPDIENHLYIETDKPTPLNISGVAYRGLSNNGA